MNVRDNIDAGKYENKVPFSIDRIPVDEETMTVKQAREHEEAERGRDKAQRRLWSDAQRAMTEQFRADLEQEHGLSGHPKADRLWSLAWEHGHSNGFSEVVLHYEEFAELVKP